MIRTILGRILPLPTRRAGEVAHPVEDWTGRRRTRADVDLSDLAHQWLNALPEFARPKVLSARHARLANQLAILASEPAACEAFLDGLLVDHRGGRGGFAPSIRAEIVRLARYYRAEGESARLQR